MNRYRKKHAGCPDWIMHGVRQIREQAAGKPTPASEPGNALHGTTESQQTNKPHSGE